MARELEGNASLRKRFRYDWERWSNGKVWILEEGIDYAEKETLRACAHKYATRHGLQVVTRAGSKSFSVQFLPLTPRKKPKKLLKRSR